MYKCLVRPILEYGSSFWDPHYECLIDDLEKVQKRAARFVTRNYTYEKGSMTDILKKLKDYIALQRSKRESKIPTDDLFPKIGVVGINTP